MEIINNIKVNTESRNMFPDRSILGVQGENEVEKLIFKLKDNNSSDVFFGGTARLETRKGNIADYLVMKTDIENQEYYISITNELLKDSGSIDLQIRILVDEEEVFKSKSETFEILEGINATQEIEENQLEWVDEVDKRLDKAEADIEDLKQNGTGGGSGGASGDYIEVEQDPTVPQHVKDITEQDIEKWNKGVGGEAGKSAYDLWLENGNTGTIDDFFESLKGDDGKSGVYVGSGEMPEGCNVQIDPNGEVDNFIKTINGKTPDQNGNINIVEGNSESSKIPRITKTTIDNISSIEPNKYYVFPEMSSLTITLGGELDNSIVQEYKFRFISGNTATTLILPNTIIGEINIEANKIYEVSIIDNLLLSQSWEVS